MILEGDEFVCPECGAALPIITVQDVITERKPEPFDAKVLFEKMRKVVE